MFNQWELMQITVTCRDKAFKEAERGNLSSAKDLWIIAAKARRACPDLPPIHWVPPWASDAYVELQKKELERRREYT